MGFDQDGNEISVGTDQVTLKNSDTVDLGIEYSWIGVVPTSVSWDHEADNDNILGLTVTRNFSGVGMEHQLDWNVDRADVYNTLTLDYALGNFTPGIDLSWDIDDFEYTGSEFDLTYDWQLSNRMTLTPNVSVPWDDDGVRGTTRAGISVSIDFGSPSGASEG
jgi:hypothetical protein